VQEKSATSGNDVAWIKSNQGIGACITVVVGALVLYLANTDWVYQELRDGFRLGFFPLASAVAMLACGLAMLVDGHRHDVIPDVARSGWLDWAVAIAATAVCYLYFELAWRIDFLLVTPIFLAGATYVLGVRPLRSAILAGVLITIVVYGLFWLIGIDLPMNVLGRL